MTSPWSCLKSWIDQSFGRPLAQSVQTIDSMFLVCLLNIESLIEFSMLLNLF